VGAGGFTPSWKGFEVNNLRKVGKSMKNIKIDAFLLVFIASSPFKCEHNFSHSYCLYNFI
jgi:hypothetical protein